jgi:hypothetical protein
MKSILLILAALAGSAYAQQPTPAPMPSCFPNDEQRRSSWPNVALAYGVYAPLPGDILPRAWVGVCVAWKCREEFYPDTFWNWWNQYPILGDDAARTALEREGNLYLSKSDAQKQALWTANVVHALPTEPDLIAACDRVITAAMRSAVTPVWRVVKTSATTTQRTVYAASNASGAWVRGAAIPKAAVGVNAACRCTEKVGGFHIREGGNNTYCAVDDLENLSTTTPDKIADSVPAGSRAVAQCARYAQ